MAPEMVFLTVQNLGSAMADVVVDAMIAEAVRCDKASYAGDLQSISWSAMALGGICGSLLGGFALSNLQIYAIFLLFTVLPCIQLLSCCSVEENFVNIKFLPEDSVASDSHINGSSSSSSTLDEDSPLNTKVPQQYKKKKEGQKEHKKYSSKYQQIKDS